MTMKCALCAIALATFVAPALAENVFYVAQDTTTKKCSVVGDGTTPSNELILGDHVYTSKTDAQVGMAAEKSCVK